MELDILTLAGALVACAMGGLLKGATGAGAPIIGVPVLAALVDVQFAVAVFVVPNLLTNFWQGWQARKHLLPWPFLLLFSAGGGIGAVIGTYLLAGLPSEALLVIMSLVVLGYVVFRLLKSDWILPYRTGLWLAAPIGLLGGTLQGAIGISAPASLSFLNALKLPRLSFIGTISIFFAVMSAFQFERLIEVGLLTGERFLIGLGATLAILAAMPIGGMLARKVARETFDRIILGLLVLISAKILVEVFLL